MNPKIVNRMRLRSILKKAKGYKKKVVFTNGCFDILHSGHVRYLKKAKEFGDILIVGLNTDESVRGIKGKNRPIVAESDRAEILSALTCVDYIILFSELTPAEIIDFIKPDILVKGADYRINEIVGRETVGLYGGKVKTISLVKGKSTSDIIKKIKDEG